MSNAVVKSLKCAEHRHRKTDLVTLYTAYPACNLSNLSDFKKVQVYQSSTKILVVPHLSRSVKTPIGEKLHQIIRY